MQLYAIMRRRGWQDRDELDEAGERSNHAREVEMDGRLRWVRSYFFREQDGSLGTICIYEAQNEQDVREHAQRGRLPADEVLPVFETVVNRPDPDAAPVA
jgi:Protein of unknown function (DUF4242)